jgi:hypothetical protein
VSNKSSIHILVIESNRYEINGEFEWHVEHNEDCPQEEWLDTDFEGKHEPMMMYTCGVEWELQNIGIEGFGEEIFKKSPGKYEFYAWSSYDSYNHEYDGGLEFV